MNEPVIPIGSGALAIRIGELIRDARRLIGWTQGDLARRAGTSQSTISRLERGLAKALDSRLVQRVFDVLGIHAGLATDARHLADRRRQREPVHASINGFIAGHLEPRSFATVMEAQIGHPGPRGWIDVLGYRRVDRALIVNESKGDLPDVGAFQRSLAFYERSARDVANELGWRPTRIVVLATLLDSATMAQRVADNRELLLQAFPSPVDRLLAWIDDPAAPAPFGWTLATCDPASRARTWLRPPMLGSRRRPPAYTDYADAANRLRSRRRPR